MSAPETGRRASFSSAGYEDGFGRRALVFDREQGTTIERLTLRPEFGVFEASLTVRAARLAQPPAGAVAGPTRVHRLQPRGPLVADSPKPAGDRLSDLLEAASEGAGDQAAGGVDAALGFLLAALPVVEALHSRYGLVHGAIGPGRLLLTPDAGIVVLDAIYGDALQALALSRRRLWTDFGVACDPAAGPTRFTAGGDLAQVSLTALMILLGRAPAGGDSPEGLQAAIAEAIEIAEIRGGSDLATGIRAVMTLAIPGGAVSAPSAAAAHQEVRRFVDATVGITHCRAALATFADTVRQLPLPPPKATVTPPAVRLAAPQPLNIAPILSAPLEVRIDLPEPPRTGAPHTPAETVVAPIETVTPPHAAATVPDDAPVESESLGSRLEPLDQVAEPVGPARADIETTAEPADAGGGNIEAPISEAVAPEPPDGAQTTAQPEPARAVLRERSTTPTKSGRNKRGRRAKAKDREPAAAVSPAPVSTWQSVDAPAAVTPAPAPPRLPQPVFPQPAFAQPVFSPPPYPGSGQASPYLESAGKIWQPTPIAATPAPVVPVAAVPAVSAAKPIGIRVKTDLQHPAASPVRHPPVPRERDDFLRASPERSRRRWPLIPMAAIVVLGAAGVYGARAYVPSTGPAEAAPIRTEVTPARTTGTLAITSIPSGARVLIDGQPAGETPLTLDSVAPGRRTVTVTAGGGSARRTVDVEAGDTLELSIPVYSGWLAIEAPIVLEVSQGGRVLGTTEQSRMLLPPGRHTISVSNRTLGYKAAHTVTIEPGEERRLSLTPTSSVSLNASPWAEVWIDGRHVGETPLSRLAIPLGTREIVFKHPQYGERRLTPTIRYRDPEAITVDMTKPDGTGR